MKYKELAIVVFFILFSLSTKAHALRDTIIIGTTNIHAPHEYINHDGTSIGYSVELIERILVDNNIPYKVQLVTMDNYLEMILSKKVDILVGIVSNPDREEYLLFSDSYYFDNKKLVFKKGNSFESLNDAKNKRIAVVKNCNCHYILSHLKDRYSYTIIKKNNTEEILKSINNNECDLGLCSLLTGLFIEEHQSIPNIQYSKNSIQKSQIRFATRKGHQYLINLINADLKKLKEQKYLTYLENKWIIPLITNEKDRIYNTILSIGAILIFIIIILTFVNSILKKKVRRKTKALNLLLEKTKHTKEEAENSNKLKSIFLSNMSHEIRTPLNSICGFSNLLAEDDLSNEERQEYIKIINNNSEQLTALVSDIIDISKIEADQIQLINSDFNVNDMLFEIHKKFLLEKVRREKHDVNIRFESPLFDIISNITSDQNRIIQIISNLIGNALKFTEVGEICFGYSVIDKDKQKFLEFYVKDSGIGMKKEDLKLIFQRYKQTKSEFTHLGTGLGLSISQRLTEMLGGEIWVESELGKGTQFYFTIPYNETDAQKDLLNTQVADYYKWNNKSVVFINNQKENKNFISSLLNPTGINKIAFDLEAKALEYVKQNQKDIDLVLVDLNVSKTLGIEASRLVKEFDPNIPIVAIYSSKLSHESEIISKSSCDDFIQSHRDTNDFYNILNLWLNK